MSQNNKHITDFQSIQRERILKSYNTPDLQKAEGSRGGTVIGHTKSGKPIYEHSIHNSAGFSKQDHSDAISAHMKSAKDHQKKSDFNKHVHEDLQSTQSEDKNRRDDEMQEAWDSHHQHQKQSGHHSYMAEQHQKAMSQASDEGSDQKTDLHFDKRQAIVDMLAREKKGLKKSEEMSDELVKAFQTLGLDEFIEGDIETGN